MRLHRLLLSKYLTNWGGFIVQRKRPGKIELLCVTDP